MTNEELKRTPWDAANKLRGSVSAAEYKYPVLGMVFLKYVSDLFDAQSQVIRARLADPASECYIEDEDTRRVQARRSSSATRPSMTRTTCSGSPRPPTSALCWHALPRRISHSSSTRRWVRFYAENPPLRGVLYREFSRLALEPGKLGELMGLIARPKFDPEQHGSRDVFGEVYEYFLGQLAMNEGAKAGEFYTPKNVVDLLVEILAPFKGKIYDPACGSGGMFVQSAKFKDAHQKTLGKQGDSPSTARS